MFLSVFFCVHLWFPPLTVAQEGEVVANFAAGRVLVIVAKDAIVFAAIENKIEPEARGPQMVQLTDKRVAILLGAAEWVSPDGAARPVRLEEELPLVLRATAGHRRLQQEQENDLEAIGIGFLEPLRKAAGRLHNKVALRPDEPLVELLLVGYLENYGPEVWSLRYRMAQDPLRGNYWQTRVLRPAYDQLYPPEKGRPRTLMEVAYPPADDSETLMALLRSGDAKVAAAMRNPAEPAGRAWAALEKGESHKARGEDVLELLRAAISATVPHDVPVAIGMIREAATRERPAFEWIVAPKQTTPQRTGEEEKREPGAPTLRKKPPAD